VVVALVQTLVLGWMVFDRVQLLRNGRQIVLPIVPVDPRALFRGDYLQLGYPISRIDAKLLEGAAPAANQPLYVTLQKTAIPANNRDKAAAAGGKAAVAPVAGVEEQWKPLAVRSYFAPPNYAQSGGRDRIVLKARQRRRWPRRRGRWPGGGRIFLRYGIEKYFLREGTGKRLEKLARKKRLSALIAVDSSGNAAIKGLLVDGKLQYEEPLF